MHLGRTKRRTTGQKEGLKKQSRQRFCIGLYSLVLKITQEQVLNLSFFRTTQLCICNQNNENNKYLAKS